jgi:hypothetical protein
MFRKAADFEAFECVMVEAHRREPIRSLAYCILSIHWHLGAHRPSGGTPTQGESIRHRFGGLVRAGLRARQVSRLANGKVTTGMLGKPFCHPIKTAASLVTPRLA